MYYYICEYAHFKCGIKLIDSYDYLIKKLCNEYGCYYNIQEVNDLTSCDAIINITNNAYEEELVGEEVCIHSSHSKNIKYLIDGSKYTQTDANIFAITKKADNNIYYYITSTRTKIKAELSSHQVWLSGDNIYNILIYIYETLLNINIEHNGGVLLHAACCQWNNIGYIITGKSGSGKTTMMFDMLKHGGLFHSNDRVALFHENNSIIAYSIPIPVNVPLKTMQTLSFWNDNEIIMKAEPDSKIRFLVPQLTDLFNGNMISTSRIHEIIIVNYSKEEPSIEYFSCFDIDKHLDVLSPIDDNHPKWLPLFDYPNKTSVNSTLKKMCKELKVCKISGQWSFDSLWKMN